MKRLTYQDILGRLGYFRNRAKLSARETSFRLGKTQLYLKMENMN